MEKGLSLVLRALILLLVFQHPASAAGETIELTCRTIVGTDAHDYVERLYGKALGRLGYKLKVRRVNRLRAQALANSGAVDGLCGVIGKTELSLLSPKMLRMDLVIAVARVELWVKQEWRESAGALLSKSDAVIAYPRGDQSVESFFDQFKSTNMQGVPNELAGFKMLQAGRQGGWFYFT